MGPLTEQLQLIGLMAAHESAIAELYQRYAANFPEQRELFSQLAAEEVEHARLIAGFADEVRAATVRVNLDRFSSQAILASFDQVRERLKEAEVSTMSLLAALSIGVTIEETLIEKHCFDTFEDDSPELMRLFATLSADIAAHRDRLQQVWEEERLTQEAGRQHESGSTED